MIPGFPEIKSILLIFLASCGGIFYIFQQGRKQAKKDEELKQIKESYEAIANSNKINNSWNSFDINAKRSWLQKFLKRGN